MKITVLGSGTSQGVPMIAHDAPGLDLEDARNWRTRSSIHVEHDGFHIQVDASPEFRLQCLHNHLRQIDAVLVTHGHADHILGMDDLRRFCDQRPDGLLPVYADAETTQRIREVYPYATQGKRTIRGYPAFDLHPMPETIALGPISVATTPLPHGRVTVQGLRFEAGGKRACYFTDCKRLPPAAFELARDSDVIIIDGLRPDPHPTHLSVSEAVLTLRQLAPKQAWLTHLTAYLDHATWDARLPDGVRLAYDGLVIDLD